MRYIGQPLLNVFVLYIEELFGPFAKLGDMQLHFIPHLGIFANTGHFATKFTYKRFKIKMTPNNFLDVHSDFNNFPVNLQNLPLIIGANTLISKRELSFF